MQLLNILRQVADHPALLPMWQYGGTRRVYAALHCRVHTSCAVYSVCRGTQSAFATKATTVVALCAR
jgi:hypothetical protein